MTDASVLPEINVLLGHLALFRTSLYTGLIVTYTTIPIMLLNTSRPSLFHVQSPVCQSCHVMLTFTSHHVELLFQGLNTQFIDVTSGANSYTMSWAQNFIQIYGLTMDEPSIRGCQTAVSGVWNYPWFSSGYGTGSLMSVPNEISLDHI